MQRAGALRTVLRPAPKPLLGHPIPGYLAAANVSKRPWTDTRAGHLSSRCWRNPNDPRTASRNPRHSSPPMSTPRRADVSSCPRRHRSGCPAGRRGKRRRSAARRARQGPRDGWQGRAGGGPAPQGRLSQGQCQVPRHGEQRARCPRRHPAQGPASGAPGASRPRRRHPSRLPDKLGEGDVDLRARVEPINRGCHGARLVDGSTMAMP